MKNGEQESYAPLAEVIIKNGFHYYLIERCDWKAIYAQGSIEAPVAHEVFFIIKKFRKPNPRVKIKRWEEAFPSNSDFGKTAWSITKDREKALERYRNLKKGGRP